MKHAIMAATMAGALLSAPPAQAGDASRGAPIYTTFCVPCHGPTGAGDGPAAGGLDPKPANFRSDATRKADDAALKKTIALGGAATGRSPLMIPWGGTLSPAQIDDLVAFIRKLQR